MLQSCASTSRKEQEFHWVKKTKRAVVAVCCCVSLIHLGLKVVWGQSFHNLMLSLKVIIIFIFWHFLLTGCYINCWNDHKLKVVCESLYFTVFFSFFCRTKSAFILDVVNVSLRHKLRVCVRAYCVFGRAVAPPHIARSWCHNSGPGCPVLVSPGFKVCRPYSDFVSDDVIVRQLRLPPHSENKCTYLVYCV